MEEYKPLTPSLRTERPADPMFIPQLLRPIPNAIIVWLKDGSKLVFISGEVGENP